MRSLAIVVMERRIRAKIQWDVVGSWGKLWECEGNCRRVLRYMGGGGFEGVLANSTFYTKEREGADYCYLAFQYFCFETFPPPSIST